MGLGVTMGSSTSSNTAVHDDRVSPRVGNDVFYIYGGLLYDIL